MNEDVHPNNLKSGDVGVYQNTYRFRLLACVLPLLVHIGLLVVLFLYKEPQIPPQKTLLRVQTVQLSKPTQSHVVKQEAPTPATPVPVQEEKEIVQEEPQMVATEDVIETEIAEPVAQKEDIAEKKPVKKAELPPQQEAKAKPASKKEEKAPKKDAASPKKETATPKKETTSPKKEPAAPKKEAKKPPPKKESSPAKSSSKKESSSSSSSDPLAQAALAILDNLKKEGSVAAEKVKGAIRAPTELSSLKSSSAITFDSPAYLSCLERSYQDEIAYTLQYNLVLPEQGEVVVSLTLLSDGKVKTVKIVRAESSKNSDYVSRQVKELHFSSFKDLFTGEKDHTFVITLCNK